MKFITRLFFIILIFGGVFTHCDEVSAQEEGFSDIEDVIDEWMTNQVKEKHIPNAAMTVVHKGEIIFSKGYGFSNFENEEPVDYDTSLFRIGSISKLFTWTAIMQLVEQGQLDLDTDINEYLDFDIPEGPNDANPITLRNLLTHTPGFEDYSDAIFRLEEDSLLPLGQYVRKYLPERVFPPGEVIAYSNYGTTLAGYIVEHISGIAFADYIEKNIFEPLQMGNSTFEQPIPENLSEQMTQSYRYINDEFLPAKFEYMPTPAGAMSSSATDMAKFMIAILENDESILNSETFTEMKTEQFTSHPYLDGMTLGFIERTLNDERLLIHGGSTMLYDSGLYLLPDEEFGIFLTYSGESHLTHTKLINKVMDHYFPSSGTDEYELSQEMMSRAKKFTGEYFPNRRSFTTSEKFISLLSGTIDIGVDDEGYLQVTHMGSTNRFVEVEEGIYRNLHEEEQLDPYGGFATIVFQADDNEVIHLLTDGPMSYSKVPWYSTSGWTFLSLLGSILIVIGSLCYWGITGLIGFIKSRKSIPKNKLAFWSKMSATVYSIITFIFIIGFLLNGEMNPIYGLPSSAYTVEPAWMKAFEIVPYMMGIISIVLFAFLILGWTKRISKIPTLIHFTIFTLASLILSSLFYYWNII